MASFNTNLWPPDGWAWKGPDGVKFRGASFKDLQTKIVRYRQVNGLPPGNPAQEVNDQLCELYPGYCRKPLPRAVKRTLSAGCSTCRKVPRPKAQ